MITPERLGLCGAYNWLDGKASFEINPTGPNQPIAKGVVHRSGQGRVERAQRVRATSTPTRSSNGSPCYSIMEAPMTACGCFECIVVLVPEANGVMVVNREYPGMTPCGMTFCDPGRHGRRRLQTPGVMGVGKYLPHEPEVPLGRRRRQAHRLDELVSSRSRWARSCARSASARAMPDLLDRIADETICTDVEGLLPFLEEKQHPALTMDPLF